MSAIDQTLRSEPHKLLYVTYQLPNPEASTVVFGIGRTDGQGLRVSKNSNSGEEQISFGKDAVLCTENTMGLCEVAQGKELIIPQGASLNLLTPQERFRGFLIGDQELKQSINVSGINQAAHFAFLFEQVGISPHTFLIDYFDAKRMPGVNEKAEFDLLQQVGAKRAAYGVTALPGAEGLPVSPAVTVQRISLEDGKAMVEKDGELVDLDMNFDMSVLPIHTAVNLLGETGFALKKDPFTLMRPADEAYYLSWEGDSHVPRGAQMHGMKVAYSQNGFVTNEKGAIMGNYRTVVESGGEDGSKQEMIVFMNKFQFPENRTPKQH
jgi:hypothetical protein